MAKATILLQRVTPKNHVTSLKTILAGPGIQRVILSVAFARESAVVEMAPELKKLAAKCQAFVGIRNGITSAQAILRLLSVGVPVFAVDTGSPNQIFHPKLYLAVGKTTSRALIGSANLTAGGLAQNIEASALLDLDLTESDDENFVKEVLHTFDQMRRLHRQHVFRITGKRATAILLKEGRLEDELISSRPRILAVTPTNGRDALPRMKLVPAAPIGRKKVALRKAGRHTVRRRRAITSRSAGYEMVWESKSLSERHLNIPTGSNTNATGSIGLGKGTLQDIDHRTYFRNDVFHDLVWRQDRTKPHLERASAGFRVIVKGLDCGTHELNLTHNTNRKSKSYKQHNEMTHLRWGTAKGDIAQRDLLGRTLRIFRNLDSSNEFQIEID